MRVKDVHVRIWQETILASFKKYCLTASFIRTNMACHEKSK